MDWSKEAKDTLEWIDKTKPKPMNSSVYEEWLPIYLDAVDKYPLETGIRIIFEALGKYIEKVRKEGGVNSLAYRKVTDTYRPILGDFKWAVDTVIKQRKYSRQENFDEVFKENKKLVQEISSVMIRLAYEDAINFIGELTGAWKLSFQFKRLINMRDF